MFGAQAKAPGYKPGAFAFVHRRSVWCTETPVQAGANHINVVEFDKVAHVRVDQLFVAESLGPASVVVQEFDAQACLGPEPVFNSAARDEPRLRETNGAVGTTVNFGSLKGAEFVPGLPPSCSPVKEPIVTRKPQPTADRKEVIQRSE